MDQKSIKNIPIRILKLANVALITAMWAVVWYLYYKDYAVVKYYFKGDLLVIFIFAILYFMCSRSYNSFHIATVSISEIIYSQFLGIVVSDAIIFMFTWLVSLYFPNLVPMTFCFLMQMCISVLWSLIAHKWYFATHKPVSSAVIYEYRMGLEKLVDEYGMSKRYDVKATYPVSDILSDLHKLDEYKTIFLSGINSHERNMIIKYCVEADIDVYVIPRIGDMIMASALNVHMFHLPMMHVRRYEPVPEYVILKRVFDIVISLFLLVVFSPFMLITAIAVKSDGGPALYKQKRLTQNGKEFYILKFRSMRVDAEKDGVARLSTGDKDDRITKVGRIIRAIRFDELPQIFNIIKGDMSIVGPRPERPEISAEYEKDMPEFRLRLQAKAGLTGYAQVYGKYNTSPYDKLLMDLMYIAKPSIIEDLKICLFTVKILFEKESTEGVSEGQTTASENNSDEGM